MPVSFVYPQSRMLSPVRCVRFAGPLRRTPAADAVRLTRHAGHSPTAARRRSRLGAVTPTFETARARDVEVAAQSCDAGGSPWRRSAADSSWSPAALWTMLLPFAGVDAAAGAAQAGGRGDGLRDVVVGPRPERRARGHRGRGRARRALRCWRPTTARLAGRLGPHSSPSCPRVSRSARPVGFAADRSRAPAQSPLGAPPMRSRQFARLPQRARCSNALRPHLPLRLPTGPNTSACSASARRHGPADQLDAPDEADVAGKMDRAAARSVAEGVAPAR